MKNDDASGDADTPLGSGSMADAVDSSKEDDVALRQAYTCARYLEFENRIQGEIDEIEEEEEHEESLQSNKAAGAVPLLSSGTTPASSPKPVPATVDVEVTGLGGPLCTLAADRMWTIHEVKSKLAATTCIPVGQQRLFVGTSELSDQDLIRDVTPPSSPSAAVSLVRADPEWSRFIEMVSVAGMQLAVAPEALREDKSLVLAAVRQNGRALEYGSEELKADAEVVLVAVKDQGIALEHAAASLRADRTIVLAAVQQCGLALQFASPDGPRSDVEVVLAASASSTGKAFQYASEELRADRSVVLAAVQEAGLALRFAAKHLQSDREVVIAAVRQDGLALEYASDELRADRQVVLDAVRENGLALSDAAEHLKKDPDILACARWQRSA
eukprot:gnl/TRDRNA2_/TRDRNA2_134630_c0_seq1.p1 gnl/TRDRNA2_/TRDRNA2_134630_c0~~gnl/TRDRNA2_/TRDRNA2_134630_c0_seq1.p1  ORF type:complete len:387 (+),score=72.89 gnl/TRDRNA2_/TRDRNA2_134630_c0_seq1:212-1372(+)